MRIVSGILNQQNKGFFKNNKSGHKYIYFDKTFNKWVFQITRFYKTHTKKFNSIEKAIEYKNKYLKENNIC